MRRINSIVVLFLFLLIAVLAAIGFSREGNEGINFRETGNIVLGGAGRLPSVWYLIYEEPDAPAVEAKPRAGTGYGCTEAPRGICYHRYTIDDNGIIQDAKIVSPTAVNQKSIESDLWQFVPKNLHGHW